MLIAIDAQDFLIEQAQRGDGWEAIYASEELIALDKFDAEMVKLFQTKLPSVEDSAPLKVGYLRILYLADKVNQKSYREQLMSIAMDSTMANVIHAVETLGKLKLKLSSSEQKQLKKHLVNKDLLSDYTLLILGINADMEAREEIFQRFMEENICSAFSLYYLEDLPSDMLNKMRKILSDDTLNPVYKAFTFRSYAKNVKYNNDSYQILLNFLSTTKDDKAIQLYLMELRNYSEPNSTDLLMKYFKSSNKRQQIFSAGGLLRI